MIDVIGKPLFEAAAQTFVGAIAGYTLDKIIDKFYRENSFDGAFDFWLRGIRNKTIQEGDRLIFDGLISPYVQLFPRDPYTNAVRWNKLHNFSGNISSSDFSQMEFYAGSDDAIRTGPLNGETLVGLYDRYGYIGEGILGVVQTSILSKEIPDFFKDKFWGCRVRIKGTLTHCPAQHGFIAQGMFMKAGIPVETSQYKELPYVKISSISLYRKGSDKTSSLLGTAWAATDNKEEPYILQYGYFNEPSELSECNSNIYNSRFSNDIRVFYDTITAPSPSLSFSKMFIG